MAALTLKALLSQRTGARSAVAALIDAWGGTLGIEDASGKLLLGRAAGPGRVPIPSKTPP